MIDNPDTALYQTLTQFTTAHRAAERADGEYQEIKTIYDAAYTAELEIAELATDANGKALHSNKEKRERAALWAIDEKYPGLRDKLAEREHTAREAGRERERLHESLKTYRALLLYATAQLEYDRTEMETKGSLFNR